MHPIDLNYQGVPDAASVFLLKSDDGPVLVESGPMSTLDMLKAKLHRLGVAPESIQHIFLTHIHLDHAGAALVRMEALRTNYNFAHHHKEDYDREAVTVYY